MAHVIFLRGVNVGGQKQFQPSVLARELKHLGCTSIGAAGTFIVTSKISVVALRAQLRDGLPFEAETMICPSREISDFDDSELFDGTPDVKDAKRYVTIMAKAPSRIPSLPIGRQAGEKWQTRIIAIQGRYAFSIRRPFGPGIIYPNEIVEKTFGVAATTRSWSTIDKIKELLTH